MSRIDYSRIELLVLDVDGVMTDGRITLTPAGEEIKSFHVRDGSGMKYWQRVGKKIAILTGRGSPAVLRRAEDLGVDVVRLNCKDKLPAYEQVLAELGVSDDQTAVVGDDLPDLPLVRRAALGVATADAVEELRREADHVTQLPGGEGCVREVIELILKRSGLWQKVLERYQSAEKGVEE
ncbi:MAG TPA: phenylphosphate carboxylase subunit delta [Phycisphaerales bacterium]|nr:phenylphosphate carboxylase subunit delta [Phycisphaerales bacterium]